MSGLFRPRNLVVLFFAIAAGLQFCSTLMLIGTLVNGRRLPEFPFDVKPDDLTIGTVSKFAANGLNKKDILLALDGEPMKSSAAYNSAMLRHHAGDSITIRASRGGGPPFETRFTLPAMRPQGPTWDDTSAVLFIGILTPWFCLILGGFVAIRRPSDPAAVSLFFFLWGLSQSFRTNGQYALGLTPWIVLPAFFLLSIGFATWPSAFLWFSVTFPDPRSRFTILRWLRLPFTALAIVFGVIGGFASAAVHQLGTGTPPWMRVDRFLPSFLQLFLLAAPLLLGATNLIVKTIREPQPAPRRKLRVLLAGLALGILPLFLLVVLGAVLDRDPNSFGQAALLTVSGLFFFVPATMAYVVIVQRAMDLGIAVRLGLQYALASNTVTIVRALLTLVLLWLAVSLGAGSMLSVWQRFEAIGACVLAILLLGRAAAWLRSRLDRRFFREAVDAERLLGGLSEQVHSMIDPETLLRTVCATISESLHVPRVVALLVDGDLLRPAAAHGFGAHMLPPELAISGVLTRAVATGERAVRVIDGQFPELDAELLLPMTSKGKVLGALALGGKQSEEPFSPSDLRLLQSVSSQTGLALENSRLAAAYAQEAALREGLRRELEIARDVQQRLFPKKPPQVEGLDLAGACLPAQSVGGDYFDFLVGPNGELGLAVGDVSGKGVPAALLMAGLQASLRGLSAAGLQDLGDLLTKLNRLIYDLTPTSRFATFWYGLYDPASGRLRLASAGHNPALLLRRSGELEWLTTGGIGLGLSSRSTYCQSEVVLAPGDRLILYTDGVTEAMNETYEEFGDQRLVAAVRSAPVAGAGAMLAHIMSEVRAFAGATPQHDDITVVTAERLASPSTAA
ncbi:MAG: SpoIIE family protein phosphatase [Bryobacteraceae bacterium]